MPSIVVRADDRHGILLNVVVGIIGALIAGLVSNSGSILSGLSASALLVSFAGALALLVLLNLYRGRQPG